MGFSFDLSVFPGQKEPSASSAFISSKFKIVSIELVDLYWSAVENSGAQFKARNLFHYIFQRINCGWINFNCQRDTTMRLCVHIFCSWKRFSIIQSVISIVCWLWANKLRCLLFYPVGLFNPIFRFGSLGSIWLHALLVIAVATTTATWYYCCPFFLLLLPPVCLSVEVMFLFFASVWLCGFETCWAIESILCACNVRTDRIRY